MKQSSSPPMDLTAVFFEGRHHRLDVLWDTTEAFFGKD